MLIEVGKNKGNYLCIHERAPITSLSERVSAFSLEYDPQKGGCYVEAPGALPGEDGFAFVLPPEVAAEYLDIRDQLTDRETEPAGGIRTAQAGEGPATDDVPRVLRPAPVFEVTPAQYLTGQGWELNPNQIADSGDLWRHPTQPDVWMSTDAAMNYERTIEAERLRQIDSGSGT